jgi:hypothetical protein
LVVPISLPCQGAAPWRPWCRARRPRGRCSTRRAQTGASRAPAPNGGPEQLGLADLTAKLQRAGPVRCWYGYLRCAAGEVDDGLGAGGVDGLHHRADPALHPDSGGRGCCLCELLFGCSPASQYRIPQNPYTYGPRKQTPGAQPNVGSPMFRPGPQLFTEPSQSPRRGLATPQRSPSSQTASSRTAKAFCRPLRHRLAPTTSTDSSQPQPWPAAMVRRRPYTSISSTNTLVRLSR